MPWVVVVAAYSLGLFAYVCSGLFRALGTGTFFVRTSRHRIGLPHGFYITLRIAIRIRVIVLNLNRLNFCHEQDIELVHLGVETVRMTWRIISEDVSLCY